MPVVGRKPYVPKMVRTTVYVSQDEQRALKAKLALEGITLSQWFRLKLAEELIKS